VILAGLVAYCLVVWCLEAWWLGALLVGYWLVSGQVVWQLRGVVGCWWFANHNCLFGYLVVGGLVGLIGLLDSGLIVWWFSVGSLVSWLFGGLVLCVVCVRVCC